MGDFFFLSCNGSFLQSNHNNCCKFTEEKKGGWRLISRCEFGDQHMWTENDFSYRVQMADKNKIET